MTVLSDTASNIWINKHPEAAKLPDIVAERLITLQAACAGGATILEMPVNMLTVMFLVCTPPAHAVQKVTILCATKAVMQRSLRACVVSCSCVLSCSLAIQESSAVSVNELMHKA